MSNQDVPETAGGGEDREQAGGLGFRALSMNEIAPAVAAEPVAQRRRGGFRWLIVVGALVVLGGAGWLVRSSLNVPPPEDVQQRFRAEVGATQYAKGVIQGVTFLDGNTVRVDFAASLNTEDLDTRTTIRRALAEVMRLLHRVLQESRPAAEASRPLDRDLALVGYQGEHEMANAHYRHRTAVSTTRGGREGEGQLDIAVNVEHGAEDPPMGELQSQDVGSAAGRSEGGPGAAPGGSRAPQ